MEGSKAGDIAARMIEALHEADFDRIRSERKDDRNRLRRRLGGNRRLSRRFAAGRVEDVQTLAADLVRRQVNVIALP